MNNKYNPKGQQHYHTELTIMGLLLSGVVLLFTDIPFHIIVQGLIQFIGDALIALKQNFVSTLIEPLVQMEFSDLVGILLITTSLGLTISQLRNRIISTSYESHTCPSCNTKLHRIHRNRWQLWVSKALYLSSGCYHCETCDQSTLHFYQKTPHLHGG